MMLETPYEHDEQLLEKARRLRVALVDLRHYRPEPTAISQIPYEVARRFQVLGLFSDQNRLVVASGRPEEVSTQDYLAALTEREVEMVLADEAEVSAALKRYYLAEGGAGSDIGRHSSRERGSGTIVGSPIAALLEHLVARAVALRASDIHLEIGSRARLRYRIDGVLHDFEAPSPEVYLALISRIKILAELDIAERRRPQDGRFSLTLDSGPLELRVSIIPGLDGEGAVLRVLGSDRRIAGLDGIGLDAATLQRYRKLVASPHGLFLVTGPTGAGKTTTLYATLTEISTPKRKVVTLEDPVEYRLDGVFQVPVSSGVGFADGLRAVLRHDPDVILIGEIRDQESADIAVRASLTGHLIFTTLHTNDAVQALHRLLDIGIPFYKLKTSIIGVLAQRLVRRLCPDCKKPQQLETALCEALELNPNSTFWQAGGCDACQGLGYRGRLPVYELLELGPQLVELTREKIMQGDLSWLHSRDDFVCMRDRAMKLLEAGETSLEEVERLLGDSL